MNFLDVYSWVRLFRDDFLGEFGKCVLVGLLS